MSPKTKKPPVSYHGISFPSPFVEQIKKYIENNPQYRSVAEFTKEAVREKMNREIAFKKGELYVEEGKYPEPLYDIVPEVSVDKITAIVLMVLAQLKEDKKIKIKK